MMSEALRKAAQAALTALEQLDGVDTETEVVTIYVSDEIEALRAALAEPEQSEPVCNPHPKAPHGFNRNGSHSAGRYVCDCESWEPYASGYNDGFHAGMETENGLQTISDIGQLQELPEPVAWVHKNDFGRLMFSSSPTVPPWSFPLFTEAQLREALASHEAVMRQALVAFQTTNLDRHAAAIKTLEEALK